MKSYKSIIFILLTLLLSCTREKPENPGEKLHPLEIHAEWKAEGTKASTPVIEVPETFSAYASVSNSVSLPMTYNYMFNETMTKNGNVWVSENPHAIINSSNSIYVCAIKNITGVTSKELGINSTQTLSENKPSLTYKIPTSATDSPDLIFGEFHFEKQDELIPYPLNINIHFKHLLSGIQFSLSKNSEFQGTLQINSITIGNIYTEGQYSAQTDKWALHSEKASRTIEINKQAVSGQKNWLFGKTNESGPVQDYPFITVPPCSSLPTDAYISMTYTDGTGTYERQAEISGFELKQGVIYDFEITLNLTNNISVSYSECTLTAWANTNTDLGELEEDSSGDDPTVEIVGYEIEPITVTPGTLTAEGGTSTITGGHIIEIYSDGTRRKTNTLANFSGSKSSASESYSCTISGTKAIIPNLGEDLLSAGTYTITASYPGCENKTAAISQGANTRTYHSESTTTDYEVTCEGTQNLTKDNWTTSGSLNFNFKVTISGTSDGYTYSSGADTRTTVNTELTGADALPNSGFYYTKKGSATKYNGTVTSTDAIMSFPAVSETTEYTVTGKYNEATATMTVTLNPKTVTGWKYRYEELVFSANPTEISATGGTSQLTCYAKWQQCETYSDGSDGEWSDYIYDYTPSITGSATGFSRNSLTVTAEKNNGAGRSVTYTASYKFPGDTYFTTKDVEITQSANELLRVEYQNRELTISAQPDELPYEGGTSTLSYSATWQERYIYTNGDVSGWTDMNDTKYGTPNITISGSATGFTRNEKTVTASENTGENSRNVTYTASYEFPGQDEETKASVTITQNADTQDRIDHYEIEIKNFSYNGTATCEQGTQTSNLEYTLTAVYKSGNTQLVDEKDCTVRYTKVSGSSDFNVNEYSGTLTRTENTLTETRNVTVRVTVSYNGAETKTKDTTVIQEAADDWNIEIN